jgi:hypothetical protein
LAEPDVIAKIEESMDPAKREPFFFLGNTKPHPQNFMVVGLYYPPKIVEKPTTKVSTSLKLPGF